MRATNRLVRLAILQALTCASGLLLASPGRANADPAQFDIAPQPLPDALKNFAAQAKMQLLYRYDVVRNATATSFRATATMATLWLLRFRSRRKNAPIGPG